MSIKLKLFELASEADQAQRLLDTYKSIVGKTQWDPEMHVEKEITEFQLDNDDRIGYVLLPLIPGYRTLCVRFCVFGHAFRTRGYEPIILRDDKDLPVRPELTVDLENKPTTVEGCRYMSKKYPELFNIKTVSIGDVLGSDYQYPNLTGLKDGNIKSLIYRGTDIYECAAASTRKYLKIYTLNTSDQEIRRIFENFLYGGILIADATKELLDSYNIEITVVNEGSYIQGKVPLDISEKEGVKVYHQANGYQRGKLLFGRPDNRHHMPQFSDSRVTDKVVNTKLSERQNKLLDSLIQKRKGGDITPTTNNDLSVEKKDSHMIGVFSHLMWDSSLEPEQAIYENIYDWLGETIEVASQKEDTRFIIKAHPWEEARGTNESTGGWIEENHSPLPDNIEFLPPDTDVNTYALIEDLDAGVVYASTVGLEMALDGVPVLVGGYPPYHGFGITHDPSNKSEYREKLQNIENLKHGGERQKRARRFAYFHFICKHLDFPPLAKPEKEVHLKHEDFIGEESVYGLIADQILKGEEVIKPGCMGLK